MNLTGYGKSLCYALLPYAFDALRGEVDSSTVVCVSPLLSLMVDQRDKFSPRGLQTEFVGEIQDTTSIMENVKKNKYQLIFVSPESLIRNAVWREVLGSITYQNSLVGLVIDEAHCVKHW